MSGSQDATPNIPLMSDTGKRRILLMTTNYGVDGASTPLANELVQSLAAMGHEVFVLALAWNDPEGPPFRLFCESSGAQVALVSPIRFGPLGRIARLSAKWLLSQWRVLRVAKRVWPGRHFDLLIAFGPLTAMGLAIRWALGRSTTSVAYHTDFFPFHNSSLGALPKGLPTALAAASERALLNEFEVAACMSPMGEQYLRRNYQRDATRRTLILPLWSSLYEIPSFDRDEMRARYSLPLDRDIALFGGQITHGRGIEDLLAAAWLALEKRPGLHFVLLGRGALVPMVRAEIARGLSNLTLIDALPRHEYLQVAGSCDVGVVATVPNVDVPTFPSKTIDYLRAGLPIVASVESATDYGDFIEEHGLGIAFEAGDGGRMLRGISEVLDDPRRAREMVAAGRQALSSVFDVRQASQTLLRLIEEEPR